MINISILKITSMKYNFIQFVKVYINSFYIHYVKVYSKKLKVIKKQSQANNSCLELKNISVTPSNGTS